MKRADSLEDFHKLSNKLKNFCQKTKLWQTIATTNEIIMISQDLSVRDAVEILTENNSKRCLLVDERSEDIVSIFMIVDFINLILSFDCKNKELFSNPEQLQKLLSEMTMQTLLSEYKKYASSPLDELISAHVLL